MLSSPAHVIVTMRQKSDYAQADGDNGKKTLQKIGMAPEQRDGIEYEFTTVLDIIHDGHLCTASKDRTGLFTDVDPFVITTETGEKLLQWLESGEDAPTPAKPKPKNRIKEFAAAFRKTWPDAPIEDMTSYVKQALGEEIPSKDITHGQWDTLLTALKIDADERKKFWEEDK
jgi:hypothetical protein